MNMKKSRDPFWDAAKGVAIVLVAFGHAIQYGSGRDFLWGSLYFNQRVFQFIYSFHMPLFMLISGYFFNKTLSHKKTIDIVVNKFQNLFVPIVCFTIIKLVLRFLFSNSHSWDISSFPFYLIDTLWFLWACLGCSFVCLIIEKSNTSRIAYIFILLGLCSSTNLYNIEYITYMLPYFLIGMYVSRKGLEHILYRKDVLIISSVLFAILLLFYNQDCFIYTTGTCVTNPFRPNQIFIDIYRWTIGFAGSICVLCLIKFVVIDGHKWLRWIGSMSMGIYCWQDTACRICFRVTKNWATENVVCWMFAFIIILGIPLILTFITSKSSFIKTLLYGKR